MKKLTLLALFAGLFAFANAQIHEETFDTDLGSWTGYTIVGDQAWEWADFGDPAGCAKMSGYDGSALDNEDWLVSPQIDLSAATNTTLNFQEAINYGGPIETQQTIWVSTDYSGSGDPTSATWTELTVTGRASGSSWDFVSVDEVDLSAYDGEANFFIAMKYLSDTDDAATWELDNITVDQANDDPMITVTYPNGGEVYEQGDMVDITWTSENFTDNVKIELMGTDNEVIASSVENNGTYTWEIAADQTPADDYTIKISDAADGDPMDVSDATFTIEEMSNYLFEGTFDSDLSGWTTFSTTGDQAWEWADFGNPPGSAKMSGYDGGALDNEDWLISSNIDLSAASNAVLNFDEAINYGTGNIDDEQEVYVSTDYSGSGDPSAASWTKLTVTGRASGGSWDFVPVDEVDISDYDGEANFFVAFKYTSTVDGGAATWEVDNVVVESAMFEPSITVTYPNGGEVFTQGETVDIQWDSEDFSDNVKIELMGSSSLVIAASTENTGSYSWDIPADQTPADDYTIKVSDAADGDPMDVSDAAFTIEETVDAVFEGTFDADLSGWTAFSASGDLEWYWDEYGLPPGCAVMSGYDGGALDNEDWLITSAIDLTDVSETKLNFDEAINYGTGNIDNEQEVYVSTDYSGSGDPSSATWTKLTVTGRASGSSWDFVSVDEVDLSAYDDEPTVYIAFAYTSTTDGAATWEVDNVIVTGNTGTGIDEQDISAEVRVYPNPSEGFITIASDKINNAEYTVFSVTGEMLLQGTIEGNTKTLNLSNATEGIYTIRITEADKTAVKRVIIK